MTAHATAALAAALRDRVLAGDNAYGPVGDGTNSNSNAPMAVSNTTVSNWLTISAGGSKTCGLAAGTGMDGKAYCWGEPPPRPAMNLSRMQVHRLHKQLWRLQPRYVTASSQV